MRLAEWMELENLNYVTAARRLRLLQATTVRRYALGLRRPRPERIAEIHQLTDGKVTVVDWYPEMPDGEPADQVNGVSTP